MMKVAVVTGAYKGLGLEWCRQLGKAGYQVVLTARNQAKAEHAALSLISEGLEVHPFPLDITKAQDAEALRLWVAERFGHIDVLINNAGINSGTRAQGDAELKAKNLFIDSLDKQEVLSMVDINAISPILLSQALRPLLAKSDAPRIVNIGSWLGSIELKLNGGNYSYALSKSALNMMNRAFAFDVVADNIVSVVVNPGWVQTDMGGKKARLSPGDSVASMIEQVLDKVSLEDTGKFFNYNGDLHPW